MDSTKRTMKTTPRTKTKKAKPEPSTHCRFGGCTQPVMRGDRCFAHDLVDRLSGAAHRSMQRGQVLEGLLASAGSLLINNFGTALAKGANGANGTHGANGAPRPASPPPLTRPNPWTVLGLDPQRATKADIRRVQRKLAEIYHTDKADDAIAAGKIAEINAAAQACLKLCPR